MRSLSVVGLVGAVVLAQVWGIGCGGAPPPPVVVRPPPLVITGTPPPPPTRAKWIFADRERSLSGKLDLGAAGVLYVGLHGRRQIVKGDDAPVDATTLALDDLVGVLRDDKGQYVFIGDDGDTFVAKEPLGAIASTRPGPFASAKPPVRVQSLAVGKGVIMAVSPIDGSVVRSTDFGVTWTAVAYAGPSKPFGRATSIALDGKGNGLLVHLPQRVFTTHDDGASWTPIASPGIGARRASRDGGDRLFLEGFNNQRAKLDGNALAVTTESPQPFYKASPKSGAKPDPSAGMEKTDTTSVLAGDRLVELASVSRHGKNREIEVSSGKLGEKADKTVTSTELLGREGLSHHVAAWGSNLVYLRDDDDADEGAPTRTVFSSTDYGASWTKGVTLEGGEPEGDSTDVKLGPKGWAFVPALCGRGERYGGGEDDEEGGGGGSANCGRRQIRPAGASAFEDMAFTEDFTPEEFVFDEAHDKVYALGTHQSEKNLYESPLGQNKFTRTKLLDGISGDVKGISVDAKGTLRVFTHQWGTGWTVLRHDLDAKDTKDAKLKRYLPLDRGDLNFVGARGLLLAQHNHGWETADGGETWIRVATNGAQSAECSEGGCISGKTIRAGWDLPAAANEEKITASADPPPKTTTPPPTVVPAPAPPTMTLACKPSGATTSLPATPPTETADARADARWTYVSREPEGKVTLFVGGRNAAREVALLPAQPKKVPNPKKPDPTEYRTGDRTLGDGVIAARYTFQSKSSTGTFNPVDVELAWLTFSTGKVARHTLPKLKPFRVPGYGFAGEAQLVQGGLLYQPTSTEPAFFVRDDGKVETLTLPPRATVRNALHLVSNQGQRWLLEDADWGTAQISWSDDGGKSWKQKAWTLDDSSSSLSLVSLGGKPNVALSKGAPLMLFGLDTVVPDDPPAPTMMSTAATINNACDPNPGALRMVSSIPYDKRGNLRIRIEGAKGKDPIELTSTYRVAHGLATGGACSSTYQLSGNDQTAYLYADGASWSGWRFRRGDDPKKPGMIAEPISCAAPK